MRVEVPDERGGTSLVMHVLEDRNNFQLHLKEKEKKLQPETKPTFTFPRRNLQQKLKKFKQTI
jgi:hypothetical protein